MTPAFLVVDKPPGITSHDVVAIVRAVTGIKKVGHTGTLDPFATGVLPLALGPATRLIQFLDESMKVYDATIALGLQTDTGDPTGQVIAEAPVKPITADVLDGVLEQFVGDRMQTPPAYSAVKKDGKALYRYARAGEKVVVDARPIVIHGIERTELGLEQCRVTISCGRGTYARVLAEEIAVALGTVGHLSALSRLRSGPFTLDRALTLPVLAAIVSEEPGRDWHDVLMSRGRSERVPWRPRDDVRADLLEWLVRPLAALSHLPVAEVDARSAAQVRSGQAPPVAAGLAPGDRYVVAHGADLVAIAEQAPTGGATLRVVPPPSA